MYLWEKRKAIERQNEITRGIFHPRDIESQVIEDKEEQNYVSLMTSASHTYGNVVAFIQKWVMELFPENLFKTVHINSKLASKQLRSTGYEMLKKSRPMIIFRPRIPGRDEDRFLKNTEITERLRNIASTYGGGVQQPFFSDGENNFSITYQLNRSVLYMDVVCIFSTLMQQLDYYHYINNMVPIGHPMFLETCLENCLPEEMMKIISKLADIPIYDGTGSVKPFLTYLRGNSVSTITYKLRGASGHNEFYRYYPVNIDTIVVDLDKDEGSSVGQTMDNYQITFTIRTEFWTTGFYQLFSDHLYDVPKIIDSGSADSTLIPIFTDVMLREDLHLKPGWHLYNRASYRLETENDVVNINELLNDSLRQVIKYHNETGSPIEEFIDLKIRKQGTLIHYGTDYTVNWDTTEITFINQNIYNTFTIMICANIGKINELTAELFGLNDIKS